MKRFGLSALILLFLLLSGRIALAQTLTLSLTQLTPATPNITAPGTDISLSATLLYTGTGTIDLLGSISSITGPPGSSVTWDDTDFILSMPFTLSNGETYTGPIGILVPVGSPAGAYQGTYTVEGLLGSDAINGIAEFNFTVQGNATTPEPGSLTLLALSMMGGIALWQYRRINRL